MKQKDLVLMVLAVVILLGAGYIGYTQLMPKGQTSKAVTVEKVGTIPANFDQKGMEALADPQKTRNFGVPAEFSNLDNTAPFGR